MKTQSTEIMRFSSINLSLPNQVWMTPGQAFLRTDLKNWIILFNHDIPLSALKLNSSAFTEF